MLDLLLTAGRLNFDMQLFGQFMPGGSKRAVKLGVQGNESFQWITYDQAKALLEEAKVFLGEGVTFSAGSVSRLNTFWGFHPWEGSNKSRIDLAVEFRSKLLNQPPLPDPDPITGEDDEDTQAA